MPEQTRWVTCPRCRSWIGPEAIFCPDCGAPRPPTRPRRRWLWAAAGGGGLVLASAAVVIVLALTTPPTPATAAASSTPFPIQATATPTPFATPSSMPSSTLAPATPAPATPAPSVQVAPTPSPQPLQVDGLVAGEAARVTEGGLNVRSRPGVAYALVTSYDPRDGSVVDDGVQLAAGDYVTIHNGPVLNDGFAWYRVLPIGYDADSPFWSSMGWVAAGAGDTAWIVESEPPQPPSDHPVGHGMPHAAHLAGVGSAREEFVGAYPNLEWDATDADGGPCDFVARLTDVETGETHLVAEDTIGSGPEGGYWNGTSELPLSTYRIEVESTCSWAIVVYAWEA